MNIEIGGRSQGRTLKTIKYKCNLIKGYLESNYSVRVEWFIQDKILIQIKSTYENKCAIVGFTYESLIESPLKEITKLLLNYLK